MRVPARSVGTGRTPAVVKRARRAVQQAVTGAVLRPGTIDELWPDHRRLRHVVPVTTLDSSSTLAMPVAASQRHAQVARTSFPAPVVHLVDDVVWSPRRDVMAHDRPRRLVADLITSSKNLVGSPSEWRAEPTVRHDGIACVLRANSRGFAHTLLDDIPRAALLDHPRLRDEPISVLLPGGPYEPEIHLLPRLLPPGAELVPVERDGLHQLVRAAVPNLVGRSLALPPWYLERLDDAIGPRPPRRSDRRIYIQRGSRAARRRLLNEDEVVALLEERGFDIVDPDRLTFAEQIDVFYDAGVVVAPHGAALANLVFARRVVVVEIFPGPEVLPGYHLLGLATGNRYRHVHGDGIGRDDDSTCPLDRLRAALDAEGVG